MKSKQEEQREKYPHRHLPDNRLYFDLDGNLINGVFDDVKYEVRDEYDYGVQIHRVSKLWIESSANNRLPEYLRVKWGTYPPLPERLKK